MKKIVPTLMIVLIGCNTTQIKNEPHAYYKPNVSKIEKLREGRFNLLVVGKLGETQAQAQAKWDAKAEKACAPQSYFGRMSSTYYIHLDKSFEKREQLHCIPNGDGGCMPISVTDNNALKNGSDYPVIKGEVICEKS